MTIASTSFIPKPYTLRIPNRPGPYLYLLTNRLLSVQIYAFIFAPLGS